MHLMTDEAQAASATVALAHGAGAPMDSPFMNSIANGLATNGLRAVRFEFPYMSERRTSGRRHGPDRLPALQAAWREVIDSLGRDHLVIGGKSMGGRIASTIADEAGVLGLVCLGYPFHPPGKPERTRTAHLEQIRTPTLILQGTRDPFGTPHDVASYSLSERIRVHWLEDGDHSFKPRARSGRTLEQNIAEAVGATVEFVNALLV